MDTRIIDINNQNTLPSGIFTKRWYFSDRDFSKQNIPKLKQFAVLAKHKEHLSDLSDG